MNKKKLLSFVTVLVFLLMGFFLINKYKSNPSLALPLSGEGVGEVSPLGKRNLDGYYNIKYVKIAGQNIKVDLALTNQEQTQGLSGRPSLDNNSGMLFIFEYPGNYPFWMKDMNFPIDMIWLSEDMKVVYIKKDARPEDYPATYGPDQDAKYVLEVVSGFSEKNNLKEGDQVEFIY